VDWLRSLPEYADVSGVVVVDGGGTRSRAGVAAGDGELLGYAEGGPTNSRSAGDAEAAKNVAEVIDTAIRSEHGTRSISGDEVTAVLVSSASVDTAAHAEVLASGVRTVVGSSATIAVVADTIGCWAATAKLAPAVAVIAGTGSSVLAGSLEQGSRRYGGWDYVLGDEGSGFALGRAALRETLFVAEGSSTARRLADAVRERLGIDETDELFDKVYKPEVDKARVASFAADVLDLAAAGDADCLRIVDEQAGLLADTVAAAFRDFTDLGTLGCFGGIWNAAVYQHAFGDALASRVDRLPNVVHPGDTSMVGSYRLVLRHGSNGVADAAEDAAVDRFAEELAQAKEAAEAKHGGHH
jgi:N-acetylglucosamine kinase-like BadF-type ATPase